MRELTERVGQIGVAAQLPLFAVPNPERDEQLPGLIFRSIDLDTKPEAISYPRLLITYTEFINFCPFCGQDWRVPSVSEVLSIFTLSDAENEARRPRTEPSAV